MSDRAALLAAILANPDEDTPRLVYADWLQEHGEPDRAEFIRVQVELARLRAAEGALPESFAHPVYGATGEGDDRVQFRYHRHHPPARIEFLRREAELLGRADNREKWESGLPKYAHDVTFRRGFVGAVRASLPQLLKEPGALWAHHPVEVLALGSASGRTTVAKVPRCAHLARVRELTFPRLGNSFPLLGPFARCPHLSGLRALDLNVGPLSAADALALASSEHLRPERLHFKWPEDAPRAAFTQLFHSPFAARLRELVPGCSEEWVLEELASAPLAELRALHLRAGCGDAGVAGLTRSPHIRQLVALSLSGDTFTDAGAEALAAWPGLASVRALDLSDTDLTGAGVEALVASPHFKAAYLNFFYTSAGDIGAAALARWPGLANVRVLNLQHAQVCDTGAIALARSPHWRDLRYLLLSNQTLRRAHEPLAARFGAELDVSG
jgi:uncharacterized protein (TIGR02996 family)